MARVRRKKKPAAPPGPARDTLFEALLERIVSGELPAGSRLPSERELSVAYAASRNTLREAIRRLEEGHLVSTRHGQGVTVLDFRRTGTLGLLGPFLQYAPDEAERAGVLLDVLAPRLLILEQLVAMAAERATEEDLSVLEAVAVDASQPEVLDDQPALAALQDRWLVAMVEASHSLPLRWAANPLLSAVRDVLERMPVLMPTRPRLCDYAREVVTALRAGQADKAVKAARRWHLEADALVRPLLEAAAQATER